MYFNVNFNVLFKLIKVCLLVSELYIYENARSNDKKKSIKTTFQYLSTSATCLISRDHLRALFYKNIKNIQYTLNCNI